MRLSLQFFLGIALVAAPTSAFAQRPQQPQKPVLIREDRTAPELEEEAVQPDPVLYQKNLEVGDFYFKKKNFEAAKHRYQTAVKYGPTVAEGYLKLIKVLEKLKEVEAAIETCRRFIETNPESEAVPEFQKKALKLEKQSKG